MSKTPIKNEAFIDLEAGMVGQLLPLWTRYWANAGKKIGLAADEGRWDDAHALVESVDMGKALASRAKLLETIGMASLLLGASRLGPVKKTSIFAEPPKDWLGASVEQVQMMLGDNATKAMRQELHLILDKFEYAESTSNESSVTDIAKAVKGKNKYVPATVHQVRAVSLVVKTAGLNRGSNYIGLAANLHVSRLSTAGFLLESKALGQTTYQISEVMDKLTCPVCARMHGMTFPVSNGLDHLAKVFSIKDPSLLSQVSPWPRQTKAGVASFLNLTPGGLMDAGFHLPPYHPGCRGIVVPVETVPVLTLDDTMLAVAGLMAPDAIADRLMGNRADLDATASLLFPDGAVSALYGVPGYVPPDAADIHDEPGLAALGASLGILFHNPGDD